MAIMLKTSIVIWDRRYMERVNANYKQMYICTTRGRVHLTNVAHAAGIIRRDTHKSIHLLYDDYEAKHYEYFSGDTRQPGETTSAPKETKGKREEPQKGGMERRKEMEAREEQAEKSGNVTGEDTPEKYTGKPEAPKGKSQEGHLLGIQIGTLNVSGLSYGYKGKYIKAEEDLLKIRPEDKLREVTEMMKTRGISLMTLTDTHLGQ
eukprot:6190375-Pleurochrysis_carterae.AAC.1